MSSGSKSVMIALVPGSFVYATEYDKIVALLEKEGYKSKLIDLLSVSDGSRRPPATTDEDAEHIRNELLSILDDEQNASDVVLALHSYAGIPGSSAVKGLNKIDRKKDGKTTGLVGIVYIASYLPEIGESIRSVSWDYIPEPYKTGFAGEYLPGVPIEWARALFDGLTDEAEIMKYYGMMALHSSDSYSGGATHAGWKE